jgi:hypothetical protein
MSLDLAPETETILEQEAARAGVSVDTLLRRTFAPSSPQPDPKARKLMEAIRQWQAEDATDNDEELSLRDQERAALESNLDQNRQQLGMRPLFPGKA